jgi:hypothetical protein
MLNLYHLKFARDSVLIHPDGRLDNVSPKNDAQFTVDEIVEMVDDSYEQIETDILWSSSLVYNPMGLVALKDHNALASEIAGRSVCGPALFIHPRHRTVLTD